MPPSLPDSLLVLRDPSRFCSSVTLQDSQRACGHPLYPPSNYSHVAIGFDFLIFKRLSSTIQPHSIEKGV